MRTSRSGIFTTSNIFTCDNFIIENIAFFYSNMKIVKFSELDAEIQDLIDCSIKARENAYVPFSNFKVGASILCKDGSVHTGCNIENSSFPMTTCAERTATVKAVSEGHKDFKRLAVSAVQQNEFVSPCGSCRQTVAEFMEKGEDLEVYLAKPDKTDVIVTTLKELLPLNFILKE